MFQALRPLAFVPLTISKYVGAISMKLQHKIRKHKKGEGREEECKRRERGSEKRRNRTYSVVSPLSIIKVTIVKHEFAPSVSLTFLEVSIIITVSKFFLRHGYCMKKG
jgi:hypothetical protein